MSMAQIGFLTEWQMYAQKLEGDEWIGEMMDKGKVDKMSGEFCLQPRIVVWSTHSASKLSSQWKDGWVVDATHADKTSQTSNWDRCTSSCKRYENSSWKTAVEQVKRENKRPSLYIT